MSNKIIIAALTAPLLLVSCASKNDAPTYGFQGDGSYIVSPGEEKMSCASLSTSQRISITTIAKAERSRNVTQGAAVGLAVLTLVATGGRGVSYNSLGSEHITKEINREKSKAGAYNAVLASKKCATFDIEAEVTAAKAKIAASEPPAQNPSAPQ